MFSKSLLALSVLALSSFTYAAPALSCPAASTVTVNAAASSASSVAAVSTSSAAKASSVAATTAAAATTSAASKSGSSGNNNVASTPSFGRCSTPQIKFAANLDGRRETSFAPVDTRSFNHGSADNIDVISSFICGQLKSCQANAAAISTCSTASKAADAAAKGTGAQADAFNAAFGKTTNFAAVQQIGTNGRPVGGAASTTSKAGSATTSAKAILSTTSVSVVATTNVNIASSTAKAAASTTANTAVASSTAAASGNDADAQSSLTLDPRVIATGFESDGQQVPTAGQVASATSSNNFINFCLTVNKPLTNGTQVKTGSCNTAPMGVIASTANMPSSKFVFPPNLGTIKANTAFTIQMAVSHLATGNFVNANSNYYSAPQNVNAAGDIVGHTHVVIEKLSAIDQTQPTDPTVFAFFKGVNGEAVNGVVSADVTDGLDVGVYRLASINAAANHQPVLVAVAQHGSLDDMVYFSVTADGTAAAASSNATATDAAVSSAAPAASTSAAVKSAAASSSAAVKSAAASSSAAPAASTTAAAKGGNNNNQKGNQNQNNNNSNQDKNKFFGFGGH